MMLTASTTTTKAKKNFKTYSLSWARALAPTGSAALIDVDWIGFDDFVEEEKEFKVVVIAALAAFVVGAAAAALPIAFLLPTARAPRASSVAPPGSSTSSSDDNDDENDEDEGDGEQGNRQRPHLEKVRSHWAREKGGKDGKGIGGRLTKVVEAAAAAYQSPSL